ncbi:MAG: hypothetical protein ACI89E_000505, partial [Planctomycetota bacterium]
CDRAAGLVPVDMGNIQQLVPANPRSVPTFWSGEVRLDGLTEVSDLVVEPGTTILCGPGATLWVRGRMLARGREDAPIRFQPAQEGQEPWGAFILKGEKANGSQLEHCIFEGGSGWKHPLEEYSAMVSIHSVQDVRFVDCLFQDSKIVDDMVHGVYSEILFRGCTFRNSLSDALDMDISSVKLESCTFIASGNDALDLMTTIASVVDTQFLDSGDKGISVGERSKLLIMRSLIQGCEIGIQPKDDSVALAVNVDLIDNRVALDAYKKNWRYNSGGYGKLVNCWISGEGKSITVDKHSQAWVAGSYMERTLLEGMHTRVHQGRDNAYGVSHSQSRNANSFVMGSALRDWGLDLAFFLENAPRLLLNSRGQIPSPKQEMTHPK